jgi:uncharacterized protein YaiL (DUF2058 family)
MSKSEIKFYGLLKKFKSELKLVASYQYEEMVELGGLVNILNGLVKDAQEIERVYERGIEENRQAFERQRIEEERERQMEEEELNRKNKKALKKKSLLGKH